MAGKRGGKRGRGSRRARDREDAPVREADQRYGKVTALLGNGRVTATCDDGVVRRCKIRGSMRRREWVRVGETVLVCLRVELSGTSSHGTSDDVGDVVHRYLPAELDKLARMGEPVRIVTDAEEAELDRYVAFDTADGDDDFVIGVQPQPEPQGMTDEDWDMI